MKSISKRGFWIKWEIVLNEIIEIGHLLDGSLKKGIFLNIFSNMRNDWWLVTAPLDLKKLS